MVAEEVHTGRVLAMQGGFDVIGSSEWYVVAQGFKGAG
jgi:hypothetical protein